MIAAVDMHIHTALSPCASDEMTPNNIINMAVLKGLDVIAVTDHNSAGNCEAVIKCGQKKGIIVVPGMELETQEEVHLLCLFPELEACLAFEKIVSSALPGIENRKDIFGKQILMDENDNIIGTDKRLLLTATGMSVEESTEKCISLGGVVIPAHVDRQSYSILSNLGIIPDNKGIRYLELSRNADREEFLKANRSLTCFNFITSSDAHELGQILERETFIEIENYSIKAVISKLINS